MESTWYNTPPPWENLLVSLNLKKKEKTIQLFLMDRAEMTLLSKLHLCLTHSPTGTRNPENKPLNTLWF